MIISIASGKGGTGKTTVATNLAVSIGSDVTPSIEEKKSVFKPARKLTKKNAPSAKNVLKYAGSRPLL